MAKTRADGASQGQQKRKATQPPLTTASDREIYDWMKSEFTPADLQEFLMSDQMIPAEQLLQELTAVHEAANRRKPA